MPITVSYEEMEGSPQESLSRTSTVVKRILKCDWLDRVLLAKELIGYWQNLVYYPPDEYKTEDDLIQRVYARQVEIEGLGIDSEGEFIKAKLTVMYADSDISESPGEEDTIVKTESLQPSAEFLTLSTDDLYWENDKTKPLEPTDAPTAIIPQMDWVYTAYAQQSLPSEYIRDSVGKVNTVTVRSISLGILFAAETLLLSGISTDRTTSTAGSIGWTITYHFTYKPNGWNKFPKPKEATDTEMQFVPIYKNTGVQLRPYKRVNFANLF